MYPIISRLSFLLRFWISYKTIGQLPIFSNGNVNYVIGQTLSIYTIFRLICYPLVGIISSNLNIKSPIARSILYIVLYIPLIGIYWLIAKTLEYFHILPISS